MTSLIFLLPLTFVTSGLIQEAAPEKREGPPPAITPWSWTAKEEKLLAEREKEVREQDGFFHLRAGGWKVEVEVDARFAAELSLFLDLFEKSFREVFSERPQVSVEPTVVIYAGAAPYLKKVDNGERAHFHYTWEGKKWPEFHVYSYVANPAERQFARFDYPALQHEAAHALLRRMYGKNEMPQWFDEGVSAWFQAYDVRADRKKNFSDRYERSRYLWYLRWLCGKYGEHVPKLSDLTSRTRADWNPDHNGVLTCRNYALGESLADFLLVDRKGKTHLEKLVKAITRGQGLEPLDRKDLERLEALWVEHVQSVLYGFRR